jgi:iron complex transport system substrate-binding protein
MQQLTRATIPFFSYRHSGLAGVTETIRALGARTGRTTDAETVAAGIEKRFAALRERAATRAKPRTMLVFGRERGSLRNIYASGGRGFLHDMLEAAGGINVFADIQAESVQATSELILTRAPDVIIEIRSADIFSDADRAREIDSWRPLASVPAVRMGRVHLLTRKGLAVPGPGIADSAEELAQALHGR